jgi:PIN domain nuclease of toxin-antitoxin system
MRLLLDTHAWLWWFEGAELDDHAIDLIADPSNDVFVSAASVWEVAIKHAIGKLQLKSFDALVEATDQDFTRARIDFEHARLAGELPPHHRDPFDRMLVAQASIDGMTLLTRDRWVQAYQVATLSV